MGASVDAIGLGLRSHLLGDLFDFERGGALFAGVLAEREWLRGTDDRLRFDRGLAAGRLGAIGGLRF